MATKVFPDDLPACMFSCNSIQDGNSYALVETTLFHTLHHGGTTTEGLAQDGHFVVKNLWSDFVYNLAISVDDRSALCEVRLPASKTDDCTDVLVFSTEKTTG